MCNLTNGTCADSKQDRPLSPSTVDKSSSSPPPSPSPATSTEPHMKMLKQNRAKILRNHRLLFICVMTLSAASFFSAMLQLEKVYFLHYDFHPEEKPLISSVIFIPVLSTLAFRESMALCSLTVCFLAFYIYHQIQLLTNARLNMPIVKVSTQLPFLGTALEFLSNTPWDLMEDWHRSYGRIYSFKLLGKTMVSIEHPDHLKEVLQSKIQNVKKDVGFAYKPFLPILGKGIVTSEGKSWMNQRRKISAALKVDILEEIPRATLKSVKRLMVKMDKCVEDSSSTIDLAEELRHLTLQVISETFMGLEAEESDTTFATMYYPIVEEGNKRVWRPERSYMFFTPSFWKHIFGVRRLNNYVSNLITKRWDLRNKNRKINDKVKEENEQVHTKDILDKVLDHFEKENPGKSLSPSDVCQLRDEFKTFMLAGHETSAAMMTWSFYELMKDDKLMEKVSREAETVFGKKDWLQTDYKALPSREELTNLGLSEGCLKESLRKYSVVPTVIRQIVKPTQIGNHLIPKGTGIVINIQSTHHNEEFWPNPMTFDPSRFTDSTKRPVPFTFIPFIDGPRNCLGQYLALLESKMVVSLISQRYTLRMKNAQNNEDPRHRFMVPLIPKESMDVFVSKKCM